MKRFPPHSHIVQDMFSSSHKAKASTAMSPEAMGEVLGVSSFSAGFLGRNVRPWQRLVEFASHEALGSFLADFLTPDIFLR